MSGIAEAAVSGLCSAEAGARWPDPRERPLLKVAEVVELLRPDVGEYAVRTAISKGQIPSIEIGRLLFVPTAGLLALLGLEARAAAESPTGDSTAAAPVFAIARPDISA